MGDLTQGHNQIPVAMGQGAKAGIDVHYGLRAFPKPVDTQEGTTDNDARAAADD